MSRRWDEAEQAHLLRVRRATARLARKASALLAQERQEQPAEAA